MHVQGKVTLVVMGLVLGWACLAAAQDKPADNMPLVVEKIRADKKRRVST